MPVYHTDSKKYVEPDPDRRLVSYATTLADSRGIASVIAVAPTDKPPVNGHKPQQFRLAQCDPATGKVATRDLTLDGHRWLRTTRDGDPPEWNLAPDGHIAWRLRRGNATMVSIDLVATGPAAVPANSRGKLIEGEGIDIRSGAAFHPDGRIYAIAVCNQQDRRRPAAARAPGPIRPRDRQGRRPGLGERQQP